MTIEKVKDLLHAQPFVPFSLRLANGRAIPVEHPDFVASSPTGRIINVFHGPNDASTFVDVILVTALELNPRAKGKPDSE
jgi:hypothetical protein